MDALWIRWQTEFRKTTSLTHFPWHGMSQPSDDDRTVAAPAIRGGAESALGANALSAGARLHEFEIVDLIGEGGFGIVYLARDCVLERKVALKEYLPASLASRAPGDHRPDAGAHRDPETRLRADRAVRRVAVAQAGTLDRPLCARRRHAFRDHRRGADCRGHAYHLRPCRAAQQGRLRTLQPAI